MKKFIFLFVLVVVSLVFFGCETPSFLTDTDEKAEVAALHQQSLKDIWNLDYEALKKVYSFEFIVFDDGEVIDFIKALQDEAPYSNFEKNRVSDVYDINDVEVLNYKEMKDEGFLDIYGEMANIQNGDLLAIIRPFENSELSLEAHTSLYRKFDEAGWMVIGGFR